MIKKGESVRCGRCGHRVASHTDYLAVNGVCSQASPVAIIPINRHPFLLRLLIAFSSILLKGGAVLDKYNDLKRNQRNENVSTQLFVLVVRFVLFFQRAQLSCHVRPFPKPGSQYRQYKYAYDDIHKHSQHTNFVKL